MRGINAAGDKPITLLEGTVSGDMTAINDYLHPVINDNNDPGGGGRAVLRRHPRRRGTFAISL